MRPFWEQDGNKIYQGHILNVFPALEPESVHLVVTSPPYWGLRDYGIEPEIWLPDSREWLMDYPEGCVHVWGNEASQSMVTPRTERENWNSTDEHAEGKARTGGVATINISQGQFCQLCGAWRGSLGLEPTPELYVQHIVQIFREVKRVLHSRGTIWLNLGDSYAGSWGDSGHRPERDGIAGTQRKKSTAHFTRDGHPQDNIPSTISALKNSSMGLKPKDLVGIPWMVAFALRADGWYLRQDIIWSKPNPMPESVKDRCCKSHEYMFLFSKSKRYYFDHLSIQEDSIGGKSQNMGQEIPTNGQGKSGGEEILLFGERASNKKGVSGNIRIDRRTEREVPNIREIARKGREIQSSEQAILAKPEGEESEGEKRQGIYENGEGEILKTEDGNKTQTSNKGNGLHLDTGPMERTQGTAQSLLRILPEEDAAAGNGSRHSIVEGWEPHPGEHSSSLSELQRKKGDGAIHGNLPGRDDGGRACNKPGQTKRNKRSVWTIATQPYKDAHFATFPRKLIEPCILAGTSEKGCCPECGEPWVRVVDYKANYTQREPAHAPKSEPSKMDSTGWKPPTIKQKGWKPGCKCPEGGTVPCVICDPFGGSGTVALEAYKHGRSWILIEKNPDYVEMSIKRIEQETAQLKMFT